MISKDRFDIVLHHLKVNGNKLDRTHYLEVCKLHAEAYNHKYYEPCTCNPRTIKAWIEDLKKHFYS